jgi:hypothetical protein
MNFQFAYSEVSFFLVRLLQNFSSLALAPDAQPPSSRPPVDWDQDAGYKRGEKIWTAAHLTMFARVSVLSVLVYNLIDRLFSEYQEGLWMRMGEARSDAT